MFLLKYIIISLSSTQNNINTLKQRDGGTCPMRLHLTTMLLALLVQGDAPAGTRLHDSKLSQITQLQVTEGLPGADHRRVWGTGGHEGTGSQRHADEARRQTTVSRGQKSIEPSPSTGSEDTGTQEPHSPPRPSIPGTSLSNLSEG